MPRLNSYTNFLVCFRFKNVQFEIAATADPGIFGVSAKLMGVDVEKVELIFQVSYSTRHSNPL